MKKLAAMAGAAMFVAVIGLSHGADAAGSRERASGARPTGSDVLSSDSRESAIVARPSGMIAQAFASSDEQGLRAAKAELKAEALAAHRVMYQALTSDDQVDGKAAKLAARRAEAIAAAPRHVKFQALTSDDPTPTAAPRGEGLTIKTPPASE